MEGVCLAAGSVVGRDHRTRNINGHDAYWVVQDAEAVVAVACDGCGSGAHSEVGSKIGARLIAHAVRAQIGQGVLPADLSRMLERVRQDVLAQLRVLANAMGSGLSQTVNDYFLFTTVAAVVTAERSVIFANGDGLAVVNGETVLRGECAGNAPPYLAYGLVPSSLDGIRPAALGFEICSELPTVELQSFLLATDGLVPIFDDCEQKMPGTHEAFGPISQFWEQDRYFANADNVRRRLYLANREVRGEHGLLFDDTTVVVARRVPTKE